MYTITSLVSQKSTPLVSANPTIKVVDYSVDSNINEIISAAEADIQAEISASR